MERFQLINARVVTPDGVVGNAVIDVAEGIIGGVGGAARRSVEAIDLGGATVFPGFIDVHNHGAVGVDVNAADAEGLSEVSRFLAGRGVTAWVPTLVPDADENYRRAVGAIEELMRGQEGSNAARVLGVHYEGVYANEKMCGALRPEYFRNYGGDAAEIDALPVPPDGVRMTTLAPETADGTGLIGALRERGWIAAIGHTRADRATLDAAFRAGARHVTHFFNAMTGLHHRDPGVAGWAFLNEDVSFDIIADGVHVHPDMLGFAVRIKGADRVSLISDSVLPAGLGDGRFEVWNETIEVENGRTRNEKGNIAGSVITMLDAVRMMLALGFSEPETAGMAALNPARLLGLERTHGSVEPGKRADLVVLDDDLNVVTTFIGGARASRPQDD